MIKIIKVSIVIAVLTVMSFLVYKAIYVREVVYVDVGRLTEEYELKRDLEKKSSSDLLQIKDIIDSLQLIQKIRYSKIVDSQVVRLQMEFARYYELSNKEITKQIWERLNPVIKRFGEQNGYRMIVGATGNGNLLFGDQQYDITKELIKYANENYQTGN